MFEFLSRPKRGRSGKLPSGAARSEPSAPQQTPCWTYYYVERLDLVGRSRDNFLCNEVYQPGKGWVWDANHEIGDRLVGYDPYEEPGWQMGNPDIMQEIRAITREEAEQLIMRSGGGKG